MYNIETHSVIIMAETFNQIIKCFIRRYTTELQKTEVLKLSLNKINHVLRPNYYAYVMYHHYSIVET